MHTIKYDKGSDQWEVMFMGGDSTILTNVFNDPEPAAAMASYLNGGQKPGRKSIPTPVLKEELRGRGLEVFERVAPFTEPLEIGDDYWIAQENGDVGAVSWRDDDLDNKWLTEGICYPFNKNGKLSASLHES